MTEDVRETFRDLHATGTFVLPNPWDLPSALLLERLGFQALATTSSGFAASLGRRDQTVTRAYRDAGAGCLYAPGLRDLDDIARVVGEVGAPVNVLALRDGPSVPQLAEAGVRRVSTGGSLAWAAYGALVHAATELRTTGTSGYLDRALPYQLRDALRDVATGPTRRADRL